VAASQFLLCTGVLGLGGIRRRIAKPRNSALN
jgi:hypothetical protein